MALVAGAISAPAGAGCIAGLPPTVTRELPTPQFVSARSVAWLDAQRVLIGTRASGILSYDISRGTAAPLVPGDGLPQGIPAVEKLDTDGTTVVAFNGDRSDVAFDIKQRKMVHARRRVVMRILDMAVRDGHVAVLGFSPNVSPKGKGILWAGEIGAPWEETTLLHPSRREDDDYFLYAFAPHGGAVRFLDRDTIAFITPAEPGIFRRKLDGRELPRLGAGMTDLVMPDLPEMMKLYNEDVEKRYANVVNRQPAIDDLVVTPQGPAVVVRRWGGGKVWWELRYPDARAAARTIRLGIEDKRVAGGHLRCAAKGSALACVFGRQTQLGHPDRPQFVLFDLTRPVQSCK